MSKKEKREQIIRANIKNVSLEDFEAFINQYGTIEFGSKHALVIIGKNILAYKRENPVKPVYVKELLRLIDSKGVTG